MRPHARPTVGPYSSREVDRGPRLKDPTRPRVPVAAIITKVDAGYRVTTLDTNALTIGALSSTLGTHADALAYANAIDAPEGFTVNDLTGEGA